MAASALVEVDAGIGRHRLDRCRTAVRARQGRLEENLLTHGVPPKAPVQRR